MSTDFKWDPPPLDPDDERLVTAYASVGVPVDELPYTDDFERIVGEISSTAPSNDTRRYVFKRLLTLRKQGRLPRVTHSSP